MPVVNGQPTLLKTKSKIRLRLGFTPPHPKATITNGHSFQDESPPITTDSGLLTSTSTAASTSTQNPPSSDLAASTNSNASSAYSRDAFAYDLSSPDSHQRSPHQFDTISYTTHSPSPTLPSASNVTLNTVPSHGGEIGDTETSHFPYFGNPPHSMGEDITITHPGIFAETSASDNIFNVTDEQLGAQFDFIEEIGFGNWGSVWLCRPRKHREASWLTQGGDADKVIQRLGKKAAAGGGTGAGGKVAIKLVHRNNDKTTATRVRALWAEMKIIRSLRYEPHPSIIQFEAFVICPSYALVIMPYLADLIPVCLPPARAITYFRQLASAVGYLHERGITHNDIKPANVLLSHNDVPVLVDFGFAQRWDTRAESRGMFLSSISWGTPEYLDPQRAIGMPHDERASDVWSLGITFFEILVGRTPFEIHAEEEFETAEEYMIYYERCKRGKWLGEWYISQDLEHLIRSMVCPDPAYRITAMQAYHHPALQPTTPNVIITPHFVRAAASFENPDEPPVPNAPVPPKKDKNLEEGQKKRRTKKREDQPVRTTTPTALGESIKQHTSVPRAKSEQHVKGAENAMPSPKQVIAQSKKAEDMTPVKAGKEDIPTPTKVGKPAQPLRVKELNLATDHRVAPRTSQSQINSLSRPTSEASLAPTITTKDKRASILSAASSSNLRGANKSDAVLKTMRSLEGTHLTKKDVLGAISRPAPEPPRPRSLDSAEKTSVTKEKRLEQRRSLGILPGLKEESPSRDEPKAVNHKKAASPGRKTTEQISGPDVMPSPPRPRMNTRPTQVIREGDRFPTAMDEPASSPVANIRQRILSSDQEKLVRFRQISSEVMKEMTPAAEAAQTSSSADVATAAAVSPASPVQALDSRLESLATWVQQMERLVTDARRAIAEGRDPPTLPLDVLTSLPADLSAQLQSSPAPHEEADHRFGVTPDKKAVPEHLRTSSTQVEPATPPKWLTDEVMRETDKVEWVGDGKGAVRAKKDRPTVSHVLKLFGSEKAEKEREETVVARSKSPEPISVVPLKAPALRGVPSTPALRSSFSSTRSRVPMARKSESNLRNFATAPTSSLGHALQPSPRRVVYEDLLDSTPGVTRKGDGWSSSLSSGKNVLGKPSSMASLRRAFLGERNIVDLADEVDRERERRSATAGTASTLGANAKAGDRKTKGLFGRIKRGFGGAK